MIGCAQASYSLLNSSALMNYDNWKTTNPEDEWLGPEPPPCERGYKPIHNHPRWPSGDCIICGALCTQSCKHPLAVGEWKPYEP